MLYFTDMDIVHTWEEQFRPADNYDWSEQAIERQLRRLDGLAGGLGAGLNTTTR